MRYLVGIISMLCTFVMYGQTKVVTISDQYGYDQINSHIETAKKEKVESLTFVFEDGLYRFNDSNVINIKSNSTTEISFIARRPGKVYIMSDGEIYSKSDGEPYSSTHYRVKLHKPLDHFCTYVDQNLKSVPISDTGYLNDSLHTNIATSPIEISSDDKMVAKVRIPAELSYMANKPQSYFKNSLICYKSQWSDCYRPILRSDSEWIYFSLNEWLAARASSYVCNMHRWTKGIQPFFITNLVESLHSLSLSYDDEYIYIPHKIAKIYVSEYRKFITINNSKKRINLYGLTICGSSSSDNMTNIGGLPWNYSSSLIDYWYSIGGIEILNCSICNNGAGLLHICSSKEVSICNNRISDNHNQRLLSTIGNNYNISIRNNYFNNPTPDLTRIMCISVNDSELIRICDNTVVNVSRSFVDIGHNIKDVLISDNIIYNTEDVNAFPLRRLSSDTGVLLYSWGDCEFMAKNNIIHNLPTNYGYHGIMVDEGTGNAKIVANLIYNIGDKCVYNWYKPVKKNTNHDNELEDNILIGDLQYGGFEKGHPNNSSYKNNVFIQGTPKEVLSESKATDLGGNQFIEKYKNDGDKLYLPKSLYKQIKKSNNYSDTIKSRLKKLTR